MGLVTNKFFNMKVMMFLFLMVCIILLPSCSISENKIDEKFKLELRIINKFPNRALVIELLNNSENNYCILGFKGIDVHSLYVNSISGDTCWIDTELSFFMLSRTTIPIYNSQMENAEKDLYELKDSFSNYPEFEYSYNRFHDMIKKSYPMDRSELYQSMLDLIFNNTIFLKANEKWSDTIYFGNYFNKAPNSILKFSFKYPPKYHTWEHDLISMSEILHLWKSDPGLRMPNTFDGYKVISDGLYLSDSLIVKRVE